MFAHDRQHDIISNENDDRFEKVRQPGWDQPGTPERAHQQRDQKGAGDPHHHYVFRDGEVDAEDRFELRELQPAVENVMGVEDGHVQVLRIQNMPDEIYFSIRGLCRARFI